MSVTLQLECEALRGGGNIPMAREVAWVTDRCEQPPGRVRVSFGLHGGGHEDTRDWQAEVQYLGP
jgi:hypothetical protein